MDQLLGPTLPRSFYLRDPLEVAPELLNAVLIRGTRAGRIVEVEAYRGAEDPASHAFRGMTRRNAVMFGPPGHLYVYRSYGMHWCANAVCSEEGTAGAVLVRALAPLTGVEEMWRARPAARREQDLANGPGKLCQALGISGADNGADLVGPDRARPAGPGPAGAMVIRDGGLPTAGELGVGPRVGLSVGTEHHWRWWVRGDPNISRRPASPRPLTPARAPGRVVTRPELQLSAAWPPAAWRLPRSRNGSGR